MRTPRSRPIRQPMSPHRWRGGGSRACSTRGAGKGAARPTSCDVPLDVRSHGAAGELLSERGLAELADARLRDFVDELEPIGKPPLRKLGFEELAQLITIGAR